MFSQELIQKLKQTNISKNGEKTKERVKVAWQTLKSEQKEEVISLAGLTKASVYRVFQTGAVSAKLTVPIAQAADVNPYYLTGQDENIGKYSEEIALRLLNELGYNALLSEYEQKPQKGRRKKAKTADEIENENNDVKEAAEIVASETPVIEETGQGATASNVEIESTESKASLPAGSAFADINLTEDEIMLLLKSIMLRVSLGVTSAKEQFDKIKELLLS